MMKVYKIIFSIALAAAVMLSAPATQASDKADVKADVKARLKATEKHKVPEFFVPPPPFSEGIFPCSQCHAGMKPNIERRELYYHTEIAESFDHAADQRWCLDCHNLDDRDVLRSASGQPITFKESYYLCGQCHGTIFRDWKAGIHGKRTGEWNGKKTYRLCVQCHNPHSPRFRPLAPLPPPVSPDNYKYRTIKPGEIPRNPLGDIQ